MTADRASLPGGDRAELAMALWESLSEAERHAELTLSDEQAAELDRRWAAHVADPQTAVPTCALANHLSPATALTEADA